MEIKLDRAIVDRLLINTFSDTRLTNLEISFLDHCPLFLEPKKVSQVVLTKAFRFENVLLRESMCKQFMEEVWFRKQGCSLQEKVQACAEILTV